MAVSSRKLAALLADRLAEVLPPALTVRAGGAALSVYAGEEPLGGSGAAVIVEDDDGRDDESKVETAASAVLGGVQDCVIRFFGKPWPAARPRGDPPGPGAHARRGLLHLWYGDEQAPNLQLTPIEMSQLVTWPTPPQGGGRSG